MEVKIDKFDHFGRGICKVDGKIIFVNRAIPDEIVDIDIINTKKNYSVGKINKVINPSIHRIESICPYYNKCGGCDFLHLKYDLEKEFKINKALELFQKCDNFYETEKLNYRNKATFHIKDNQIGYYSENTHQIIDINYCYLLDDKINNILCRLNNLLKEKKYHLKSVVIKIDESKSFMNIDGLIDNYFLNIFSDIDIIICNGNVIKGNNILEINLLNYHLKLGGNAFFQVNFQGLFHLGNIIDNYLKDKHFTKGLDLYSGVSTWGIVLSKYCDEVISIELNKDASKFAKQNVLDNHISNLKVINGDVSDYINEFKNADLVVIDPPRSGLDKKMVSYLKDNSPSTIIYISCDMITLKRDLDCLNNLYEIKHLSLVDMFKKTYHCETICILERK